MYGNLLCTKVSIHASVKDATCLPVTIPSKGSVSIHASVKDATRVGAVVCLPFSVSIHASVKDATEPYHGHPYGYGFNPRICKRCDSAVYSACALVSCFNPRICKRCDIIGPATSAGGTVSIHASVKDATLQVLSWVHLP